ncbi:MAG: hypothetical protein M1839_001126 [Geoglossum umbratile]|nr:MAG: hypothetical protein M1839_001126 [Geoglossum umbratile]
MSRNVPTPAFAQPVQAVYDTPSPLELPSKFSFFFQVSELSLNQTYTPGADGLLGYWVPPNNREAFVIRYGPLCYWEDGAVSCYLPAGSTPTYIKNAVPGIEEISTASAFIQQQTGRLLAVPLNVAVSDLRSALHGWMTVGFHHLYPDNSPAGSAGSAPHVGIHNLSCLDYTADQDRLAAPGSRTWVDELLPAVYDYQTPAPNTPLPVSGGLCGKLPLILALLAFSSREEMTDRVLCNSFKRKYYQPHGYPTGRNVLDRGIVASVYTNPWSLVSRRPYLEGFESGAYGPIFP